MDYVEQCLGFVKQLYRRMCIRTFLGHSKMLLICGFEFPSRRRFSYLKGSSTISRSSLVHELAFESRYCMSCWRIVCYLLYRTIQVESNCSWYLSNGDPLSSERVAWRLGGTESFIHANFKERTNVTENPNAWDLISFGFHVVSDIAIQWLHENWKSGTTYSWLVWPRATAMSCVYGRHLKRQFQLMNHLSKRSPFFWTKMDKA
jgi:hypothetical protein